jgi:hypothetical protein
MDFNEYALAFQNHYPRNKSLKDKVLKYIYTKIYLNLYLHIHIVQMTGNTNLMKIHSSRALCKDAVKLRCIIAKYSYKQIKSNG